MNREELKELSSVARQDGQKLFRVTETLHKIGLVVPALISIFGIIAGLKGMSDGNGLLGIVIIAVFILVAWLIYLGLLLATNLCKVVVHSMFCMLGVVENIGQEENNKERAQ